VLGLTPADADAIVNFRKTNGDFADYDALAKVPNVNVEKLEKAKDAIAF
jgi:DNA uptake protein ComE-like DNA-binding protein